MRDEAFARGKSGVGFIVAGLNHAMHPTDVKSSIDEGNGDCPTCPKNAKDGQTYSKPGGKSQMFDTYVYKDGEWVTWFDAHVVTGTVPIGPGGAAKGLRWLNNYGKKGAEISVTKVGEFTKYTAKVLAQNGNGSYTVHTKYLNSYGKTIRYFHDTYNSTGRFIHRGWTEGSTKVHLWWNGIKQYGKHFFENR